MIFFYFQGDKEIDTSVDKYETTFKKMGLVSYESSLKVHNTTKADYDKYKCVALNDMGMDERIIQLDGTSQYTVERALFVRSKLEGPCLFMQFTLCCI